MSAIYLYHIDREVGIEMGNLRQRVTAPHGPLGLQSEPFTWTVLIIEDDLDNLDLIKRVLTFYRMAVHVAHNGQQALEILERLTPNLVLMDLSMPEMDGWATLKRIRANPKTAGLPVVAVTAHAMVGDRERVFQAGFDGYIAKPF